jgi:hypothetical protein
VRRGTRESSSNGGKLRICKANRKPPDWTRTGTVAGYADYIRKSADAICVLVIRPNDAVFSVDPKCTPADARWLVEEYVPSLAAGVDKTRKETGKPARLELGDLHE